MSMVDKALWVIERNSSSELNLPAVAEACGVSRSHIANAFGSTTGWPVMKYLRARRLTRAAQTLANGFEIHDGCPWKSGAHGHGVGQRVRSPRRGGRFGETDFPTTGRE